MKIIVDNITLSFSEDNKLQITLTTAKKAETLTSIQELKGVLAKGNKLDVEMKKHSKKRSNDANSLLWTMCHQIAQTLNTTKEEIYRNAIRQVGEFEILPIKDEAVEKWIEVWNGRGIGWFAEVMHDSKLPGYKNVINYYGSSVYDTKQMSILLDNIITDAKEAGIDVITEAEKESLLQSWDKKKAS